MGLVRDFTLAQAFRQIGVTVLAGIVFSCFGPCARAQSSSFEQLSEECAKELVKHKASIVMVADLVPSDGTVRRQGHYFGATLGPAMRYFGKDKFQVADHNELHQVGMPTSLSSANITSSDVGKILTERVHADVVLVGGMERDDRSYTLTVSALRIADGTTLFSKSARFPRSDFLDSLEEPYPPKGYEQVQMLNARHLPPGAKLPKCVRCPIPSYSAFAQRIKIQGKSVFEALISPEGKPVALTPIQIIGYGLDEKAYEAIKGWEFAAGTDSDGKPIYVTTPIEVTFKLY
jgi:hypothetical protein